MTTNSDIPSALSSVYSTPQPNQSILLYKGTIEIQMDSHKVADGESNISLSWLPSPKLTVEILDASLDISVQDFNERFQNGEVQLLLVDSDARASAYLNQFSFRPDVNAENFFRIDIVGSLTKAIWSKPDESPKCILGHLINFPKLEGDCVLYSQSNGVSRARAVLIAKNWKITIDGVKNISEITKELRQSGGYAITSFIKIEHASESNGSMSLSNTKKIIDALYFFLSFAVGRYSPVVLPIGFNSSEKEIWYEWESWLIPQWEKTTSWLSGKKNWDGLAQVFPGFMKKWDDSTWCEPIQRSIVWYVESGRATADPSGRIIWVQSALELLSWTYFVRAERKTEKEYKELGGAYEKIETFLEDLNISVSFSDESVDLRHLRKFTENLRQGWQKNGKERDSKACSYLTSFVRVRNDIVHPKQRSGITFSPNNSEYEDSFWIRVEALNFGLWCLELSLLKLFEYNESYTNRLKSGKLEAVPWAKATSI